MSRRAAQPVTADSKTVYGANDPRGKALRVRAADLALPLAILWLLAAYWPTFRDPFVHEVDFNGTVWAQAARNFRAAGFAATAGMPAAFYFGPPPVPVAKIYTHHPPFLSWLVYGSFLVFGEHEWAARLVPIAATLLGLVLLWKFARNAAGPPVAAGAAIAFATQPMQMLYGRMVNFEPVTLPFLFLGLLGLQRWRRHGHIGLPWLALAAFLLAVQTAWLGAMFVLPLGVIAACRPDRGPAAAGAAERRFGRLLVLLTLAYGALFLGHIQLAKPAALADLWTAFQFRLAVDDGLHLTWAKWAAKVLPSLAEHFTPGWLIAAGCGAVALGVRPVADDPRRQLRAVGFGFAAVTAAYIAGFKNASYIHGYAPFYGSVAVAIFAGVALGRLWSVAFPAARPARPPAAALLAAIIGFQGWSAHRGTDRLTAPVDLLDYDMAAPPALIVGLGRAIRDHTPREATFVCNFMPIYFPHLSYYAERPVANNVATPDAWRETFAAIPGAVGVVWLGAPGAAALLPPPGAAEPYRFDIAGERFCIVGAPTRD